MLIRVLHYVHYSIYTILVPLDLKNINQCYNRYSEPVLRINLPVFFTQAVNNNLLSLYAINYHGGLIH
jgi:hypothetical protein